MVTNLTSKKGVKFTNCKVFTEGTVQVGGRAVFRGGLKGSRKLVNEKHDAHGR